MRKVKLFFLLTALLAIAQGAWALDTKTFNYFSSGNNSNSPVTVNCSYVKSGKAVLNHEAYPIQISVAAGYAIYEVKFTVSAVESVYAITATNGTLDDIYPSARQTVTVSDVNNAQTVLQSLFGKYQISEIQVTYNQTYTIRYDANGGTGAPSSQTKLFNVNVTLHDGSSLSRTGYTAVCWADTPDGKYMTPFGYSYSTDRDAYLYAKWQANTYTVTFNKQSGTGGSNSVTATYDSAMPSATMPTRTGYTFGGYYDQTNGAGTQYYNASGGSVRSWNKASNTTLYAKWTANTYYVRFNKNASDATGTMSNETFTYGTAKALTSNAFSRTGYTFAGWTTNANGTGTSYTNGQSVSNLTSTANGTVDLYAKWTQNTATLTDGNDLSALSAWAGKTCTVTYTRSFTSGKPSTVCLPFAYTPQGEEKFYSFTGINKDGGNYTADMTEVVSPLVANTPYLFMPTGDADFSGTYAIPASIEAGSTTSGDWTFVGTYTTESWTTAPTGIYGFSAQNVDAQGINQGEFVKVGAYVRVKPMRCYLQYGDGTSDWAGARGMTRAAAEPLPETIGVRLISANGEVNAIGTLYTRTGEVSFDSEAWYTLDGKRLSTQPTQKGIYVNNGKKVVIK